MIVLLLVVFGLILGSFVNALVWRMHARDEVSDELQRLRHSKPAEGKKALNKRIAGLEAELRTLSMAKGRSMCSDCRHPLAPADLIPLFSWLFLRGRCRYCRQPIQDPPLVELALPLFFVASYAYWPMELSGYGLVSFGFWLVFLVGFAALALYDYRWYLLPDKIVWPLAGLAAAQVVIHLFMAADKGAVVSGAFWGVAIGSGVFYVLFVIADHLKRQWIGFGDVKLGIVLGLLVGGPLSAILMLYIASLLGLLASLPSMLNRRLSRGSLIPYGPFLLLACVIVVLFGPQLNAWFNRLVLGA